MKNLIILFSFLYFVSCKQKENIQENKKNITQVSTNYATIDINNFVGDWSICKLPQKKYSLKREKLLILN